MSTNNLDLSFDDILKDAGIDDSEEKPMPTVEELQAQLEKEQQEKQNLLNSNKKMSEDYVSLRSKYDKVTDRFGKTVGFVEGAGIAKYDPDTGELIRIEKQQQATAEPTPDFEKMEKQIDRSVKSLDRKLAKGDIDQSEYLDSIQDLREERDDIMKQRIEYAARKSQQTIKQEPVKQVEQQIPKDILPSVKTNSMDEYNRIASELPEIADDNSPLWQEMTRVFQTNPDYFAKGNPNNGQGDPNIYRELINQANKNLRSGNSDIYRTPQNHGYQERQTRKSYLSKDDTQNLISRGFGDKALLNDINTSIGRWVESGGGEGVEMDF